MSYFREKLVKEFDQRRKRNPSLSLRAFALFLQMPPSTLKFLLDGTRDPSQQTFAKIARRLKWSGDVLSTIQKDLIDSRSSARKAARKKPTNSKDAEVLADIAYFALSRLARLPDQPATLVSLSKKLGLTEAKVKNILEKMVTKNFVNVRGGELHGGDKVLHFEEDPPGENARRLQGQFMKVVEKFNASDRLDQGRFAVGFLGLSEDDLPRLSKKLFNYVKPIHRDFPGSSDSELYCLMLAVVPYVGSDKK